LGGCFFWIWRTSPRLGGIAGGHLSDSPGIV
jgi:hypothetical protein